MPEGRAAPRTTGILLLAVIALALLAAHAYRAGMPMISIAVVALAGLVFVRRPWAARMLQWTLALGALEWLRTLVLLSLERSATDRPYLRLVLILGIVAAITALAVAALRGNAAAKYFRLSADGQEGKQRLAS